MRDLQRPGRSPALATEAMAATSHPLATVAALGALRAGGNAVDAAVCAAAVLAVAEPHMTGIGGDCFCLYAPAGGGPPAAYNGSGRAPAAADPDALAGDAIEPRSAHAVTVPGAVEAWERLAAEHGRLALADLLAPAIRLAREGCPVQAVVAHDWGLTASLLRDDPKAARVYLPGGRAPAAGERHRQPELAATLEEVARGGAAAFYEGRVAHAAVARLRELGGAHSLEDFAAHRGERVEPVAATYRGLEVWECPPNGQGVTALTMLRLLDGFDLAGTDPLGAERVHLLCEAGRIAFAERDRLVADAPLDASGLLAEERIARLRAAIDPERAMDAPPLAPAGGFPAHRDTVCLAVVDSGGGAASLVNSLFHPWGSGIVAPGTGVLLHNRGAGFVLEPGHPNRLAPGRRPLHTLIPALAYAGGEPVMAFGVMGADYQPFGHVQLVQGIADHGLDVQAAIDLPRAMRAYEPLLAEDGIPAAAREGLAARGHRVVAAGAPLGGAQAIWVDRESGVLAGGSDQRKDGFAAGW
jgi:gamma-glutamyltranspeptidase / glutathione hydrolase